MKYTSSSVEFPIYQPFHLPCHVSHIQNQNYHLLNQMQKPVNQVHCLENQINIKSSTFRTSELSAFKLFFLFKYRALNIQR